MSLASFRRLPLHVFETNTLVCNVFIDKTVYKQKETVIVNSHMITSYNLQKMSATYEKFSSLKGPTSRVMRVYKMITKEKMLSSVIKLFQLVL